MNLDPDSLPLGYSGPGGLRFDDRGMLLPHSVLGNLEDFRSYLKDKGETELVKQIPECQRSPNEVPGRHGVEAEEELSSGHRNLQSNALQNWHTHMRQRRRQQDHLSDLLDRPVRTLLMNQDEHFRDIQGQRELLNHVLLLIHSGYGNRVGSEFWSLPQRYGDELSGIAATLTRTEQGRREPVTHIGQPSTCQESGTVSSEIGRPFSRTWEQSQYLQHLYEELGDVLQEMEVRKPDINGLVVIGSSKPFALDTECQHHLGKEQEKKEGENLDSRAQYEDTPPDTLLIPALRFCGQLASWTGNYATKEGEVGISATIIFEALTGKRASSVLKMDNEGTTAIYYRWQQFSMPHSFPNLCSQSKHSHFYFNSSSGVILPGDTKCIEFIFMSEKPGITTEVWQLYTHPVLLQGASMQVTLRGVALYQDKNADLRNFLETKLEKNVIAKMCQSIVYDVLREVQSPERPISPMELYISEEQTFLEKNPELQYSYHPVDNLKKLWEKVFPECTWDLSVDTLRQALLSQPTKGSARVTMTREKGLAQLNSLLLELCKPYDVKRHHRSATAIGWLLWCKLVDRMVDQATMLRNLLGLPENETWLLKKGEKSWMRSRVRDDSKSPASTVEESKRKGKKRDDVGKRSKEKSDLLTDVDTESQNVMQKCMEMYTTCLHNRVYLLIEDLVDSFCDMMEKEDEIEAIDTESPL